MHLNRTLTAPLAVFALAATAAPAFGQGPLPAPVAPPENPTTAEKALLGKVLFWDEQLSSDGTMACGTCHQPSVGGVDPRLTGTPFHPGPDGVFGTQDDVFGSKGVQRSSSFGHLYPDADFGFDVQATNRNTPSMIAAAYFDELFWDGRATGQFIDPVSGTVAIASGGALEAQSLDPFMSDVEMAFEGRSWTALTDRIAAADPLAMATDLPAGLAGIIGLGASYEYLFEQAFGTTEITPVRIAFALAAYQRTLVPDQSKFDRVMRGQANFNQAENRGRGAFNSPQSRCNQCHEGSLFSDGEYHNLGLRPISEDDGRRSVTGSFGDRGRFKTPSLRNVTLRERFFHTGGRGINSLSQLLNFYDDRGGNFNENKDPLLGNIRVPGQVRNDIIAFLGTLTDPRVANETAPFDRPTLWSERQTPNPLPLGTGAVSGSGFFTPEIVAIAPPKEGNTGFRIGVHSGLGGAWSMLWVRVRSAPAASTPYISRDAFPFPQLLSGSGAGNGYATWLNADATSPAMVGFSYEAQWLVRDPAAASGVARSESVLVTVE